MNKQEFIEQIAKAVRKIAPKYGIEVYSPIIAQACLESGYGTSNKAQYNNFFGLKYREGRVACHSGIFLDSSSEQNSDGSYVKITTNWYKFDNLEDGVEGYFQFININRYANLKGVKEPKEYLQNIKNDGYATSLKYVDNLLNVIKNNNLEKYDAKPLKVHLDPGHYGAKYNKNTVGLDYYESAMTWKLANFLKEELERLGVEVTLSRDNIDANPSLYDRGYDAKGKDLFISLHSNACSTPSVDYPVVYRGYDKTVADEFGLQLAQLIQNLMATKQKGRTKTRKGNNGEYYGVLRGARAAGLDYYYIVEHSFHTNLNATKWLSINDNLRFLAKKEAELIVNYFCKVEEETPKVETTPTVYYRVRKSWNDANSQIGAYTDLENAKKACKDGYFVFDENGKAVYPTQNVYIVKKGDTLGAIAKKNNTTVKVLQELNNIKNANIINVGQKIILPSNTVSNKKSVETIAKEVIQGKWGTGTTRKKKLEAAGYNYAEVQAIVNKLCK